MQDGKLPPQATDLEDAVLGALMLEKEAYESISDFMKPEIFYKPAHQMIYRAIISIAKRNESIDILTVTQELKNTSQLDIVGGAYYITQLTNRVASAANCQLHARIITQKFIQREVARISSVFNAKSYDGGIDVFDLVEDFEAQMTALKSGLFIGGQTRTTRDMVDEALEAIKTAKINKGVLGPKTGLRELDALLRGLRPPDVIVIAARPAMGKTAIVLCIAKALCIDQNIPVEIFSLEMSGKQLIHRLLSDLADIDNNTLSSGDLKPFEENNLNLAQQKITNLFMIDDTPEITIQYLESKVRKAVQLGVKYIIIDYLQLMELADKDRKGKSREQEIAFLTKKLKGIAKKYNIGVIELSQLSRSCEERDPPRPMLSDLRESGAIEQDADIVIFLYRPEYYNIEFTPSGKPSKGLAELIIAKHRNGPVDSVVVRYKGEFTRFEDLEIKKEETLEDTAQTSVVF